MADEQPAEFIHFRGVKDGSIHVLDMTGPRWYWVSTPGGKALTCDVRQDKQWVAPVIPGGSLQPYMVPAAALLQ